LASQSHFAVGHFLDLVVFRKRIWIEYDQRNNPSSRRPLAFLQSLSRSNLVVDATERDAQHLSWTFGPYSTFQRRGSTSRRPCHDPASGRLQGLVTLLTIFAPRRLAGLVSSRQRSWDSPLRSVPLSEGDRRVSATIAPA
jgi:hypothetical protein